MSPMTIEEKLNRLAELQASRTVVSLEKQSLIDQVLTPEIKARIEEIDAEFAPTLEAIDTGIVALEAEIKTAVIVNGETVKGKHLQAVFIKGRTSWDAKMLEGLAIAIPQILQARSIGAPSVTIRKA